MKNCILIAMVLSLCVLFGTAASAKAASADVAADAVKARPGETVDVSVRISGNPGLTACRVYVDFDDNAMDVLQIIAGDAMSGASFAAAEVTPGRWQALIVRTQNSTADGVLFTLRIAVDDSADGTYPISLSYNQRDTYDDTLKDVLFQMRNGSVTVEGEPMPIIPGDVNRDGTVNNADVVLLIESLVGLETLADTQRQAADVNDDGLVNNRDAIIIMRDLID